MSPLDLPLPLRLGSRELEVLVERRRGAGGRILPLQGGPVVPFPAHVREAVNAALDEPGPRPSRGLPELRAAIAGDIGARDGLAIDPAERIVVTHGAMQGVSLVLRTLLRPGDNVVFATPDFFFEGMIRQAGAEPRSVPSTAETGWRWDLDAFAAAFDERTRAVLFSNPTNPTGHVPSERELTGLLELASAHGAALISDESYDRFVYAGARFHSMLAREEPNVVVVRSLSKSHALANWRVGYVVGSGAFTEALVRTLEWECLHCGYVQQRVAAAALSGPQDWLEPVIASYEKNRDLVLAAIAEHPLLSAAPPAGTPFAFVDVRALEALAGPADTAFLELGIPVVAGTHFGAPGSVRLPLGGAPETVQELIALLGELGERARSRG